MKFKQIFEKKFKVDRDIFVPANEFIVFIDSEEKFSLKRRGESWGVKGMTDGKWDKKPNYEYKYFNGAEVLDRMIDDGWNVTDVNFIKQIINK